MRMNGWNRPMNGQDQAGHGLDPVSHILGQLQQGQEIILDRLDRQDTTLDTIRDQLVTGTAVHHSHDKRLTLLEQKPDTTATPWWKVVSLREASILAALALSGLLGILTPGEVKTAAKGVLQAASGVKP